MTQPLRILIAGAGIGGLTAAIALARAGHDVQVFEQAPVLGEVGAGLSLSQAAQSVYRELGLEPAIRAIATVTQDMAFLHYRSGKLLAGSYDHGNGLVPSDAPLAALQVHRADLHGLLASAFTAAAPGGLHLGRTVAHADPDLARLVFTNGTMAEGDLLIGADGLKSAVRRALWGDDSPNFTGQMAYRFLIPADVAAPYMGFGRAAVFQGEGCVFNRYTIRSGSIVNCVALVRTDGWQAEGWAIPAACDEMIDRYGGWHPDVIGLMAQASALIKWGIFDREPLPRWRRGMTTLLGDAAHPMLPFLGLGAAMAIEDAMILARAIASTDDLAIALDRYEASRIPRTTLVQQKSREQGQIVQATDPDTFQTAARPSHDPAFYAFDPVTAPL